MLNYSKFVFMAPSPAPSSRGAAKPPVKPAVKPKPAFQIEKKTPKALKRGLERALKKLNSTERKLLSTYVKYVLQKYEAKLEKKYNKGISIPSLSKTIKLSLKARMAMAKILKKIGRSGEYYLDRYVKVLKNKLAKKYKKKYSKPKGRAWGEAPKKTPSLDDLPSL